MLNLSEWDKLNTLALQHREGWRVFHADNDAEIRYEIAPLPNGQVAMQMKAAYRCGDNHTVTIPWRAYESRHAALRGFLEQAQRHFTYEASADQKSTQKRMLALLNATDVGFEELPPEPVEQVPRAGQQPPTQAKKVQKRREKPVQREFF